jgi:Tol biopolymer transport system component
MTLSPGTRLGPYEIAAPLGTGGMGEVFRARDTRLNRDVALKLLPDAFAADHDRLARFRREAQVLASLNHPHVAAIYGLEESDGHLALVLELVEGQTLDARLRRGPIPIAECLAIAGQIAEGLEAAHERGIIHRDLKPANVKITPDGSVKLLDFGLAKAMHADEGPTASDLSQSPTQTSPTDTGVILGTAAYMSPEQARGKPVDKRTDIWSFGVVLFEMLTGRRLFAGETVSDTLAAVLTRDADWTALPARTPPSVRRALRRCLERDPKLRLRDVGEARITLADAEEGTEGPEGTRPGTPRRSAAIPWTLAAVSMLAAIALGAVSMIRRPHAAARVRAAITPPAGTRFVSIGARAGPVVVSPDGSHLAFVGADASDVPRLYVQPLDTGLPRAIERTEGARYPFWSPDNKSLGFFAGQRLLRVDVAGGAPMDLAPVLNERGGSWGAAGVIVYAPAFDKGLSRVPAAGGRPEPATTLDPARREGTHRYPSFLPDGRHFLYEGRSLVSRIGAADGVFVGSIDDPALKVPVLAEATNAAFASGRLLFVRDGNLFAQPFDVSELKLGGEPVAVARDVRWDGRFSLGVFSASDTTLIYQATGEEDKTELVWLDRTGRRLGVLEAPGVHHGLALSRSGDRVAVSMSDPGSSRDYLRIFDVARGVSAPLTFHDAADHDPVWSPDDTEILFNRSTAQGAGLWIKPADGSRAERRIRGIEKDGFLLNLDWSPDGRHVLVYTLSGGNLRQALWVLPLTGDGGLRPFTELPFSFIGNLAQFSPDGRWVAFDADDGGGSRLYLSRFPDTGGRWQLSDADPTLPQWTKGGREIVFLGNERYVSSITVDTTGEAPRFSRPTRLFEVSLRVARGSSYDVAPDGERFLFVMPVQNARPEPYTLDLNWAATLPPSGGRP